MNHFRGALWIVACLTCTSVVAADLQSDVVRLLERPSSNKPFHLGPRILEQGDELPLLLPGALAEPPPRSCLHIVALAAQSVAISLSIPAAEAELGDVSVPSRAGIIEFIHCGGDGVSLSDASVMMLSPRGVVDIVGYVEASSRPGATRILPWRAAGDEAPERSLHHVTPSAVLSTRLDHLELQAAFQAADRTERRSIPSEDAKSGQHLIGFDPGCHQLQLVADRSDLRLLSDLGPELVWADNEQPAARELSSSATPTFRLCTAVARVAKLTFTAFEGDTSAVLFRAQFPWPSGIPSNWAVQARNQMAEALLRRHLPSLPALPAQAWIGGSSATSLVVPVAPRSCYLAMVATSQGSINDLTLAVTAESRWMADTSFDNAGAGVAFCVNQAKSVKLDVDARGTDVVWILGLWNVASGPTHADFT